MKATEPVAFSSPSEGSPLRSVDWASHIRELRNRILACAAFFFASFVIAYCFSEEIYGWLAKPLAGRPMIYTGLTEAFMTYVRLASYVATMATAPFVAAQLYLFAAPGLYRSEKKASLPVILGFPALFVAGVCMAYYGVMPAAWSFFTGFERSGGDFSLVLEARVAEYLSFVAQLCFAFGMAFQFPLFIAGLSAAGLVTASALRKKRRIALVAIAFVAAVLTPPDVISQILLAVPLAIFYEATILICRRIEKKRQKSA
ncbi:MAG: twin-arginine translocase subunit TatC [Rickettsiales bacterium]